MNAPCRSFGWFAAGLLALAMWFSAMATGCGGPGSDAAWPVGEVPVSASPFSAPSPSESARGAAAAPDNQPAEPPNGVSVQNGPPVVEHPALAVRAESPAGEFNGVPQHITVTFNQPMVPLESLETRQPKDVLITKPALTGRYRWITPETLRFELDKPLKRATRYTFTVPVGVTSAVGKSLEKPHTWSFVTQRPQRMSITPSRTSHGYIWPESLWTVTFNQPVDPKSVKQHTVLSAGGQNLPFDAYTGPGGPTTVVIKPDKPFAMDTLVSLVIKPGVLGTEGPEPMIYEARWSGRTFGPLRVNQSPCQRDCHWGSNLYMSFSSPLTPESKRHIKVTPAPTSAPQINAHGVYLGGPWKPGQKVTVVVGPGVTDIFGQKLGKTLRYDIQMMNIPAQAYIQERIVGVMERSHPRQIAAQWTSVAQAKIEMATLELDQIVGAHERMLQGNEPFGPQVEAKVVLDGWSTGGGLNKTSSKPIPLGRAVPKGKTGIVAGRLVGPWNNYGQQRFLYQITDLGISAYFDDQEILVWTTSIDRGKPVAKTQIELRDTQNKVLWSGQTGADGLVKAPGIKALERSHGPLYVLASRGDDLAYVKLDGSGAVHGWATSYRHHAQPDKWLQGAVYTDRHLYRPASKVHIKGVVRVQTPSGPDGLPPEALDDALVSVNILDARRQPIFEKPRQVALSRLGTFETTVEIDPEASLGVYQVYASLTEPIAGIQHGNIVGSFEVREFRTPQFEVKLTPTKEEIMAGEEVEVEIEGRYLFGGPMRNAQVTWTVRSQPLWQRRPPNVDPQIAARLAQFTFAYGHGQPHMPFQQARGKLDDKGRLKIKIPAAPGGRLLQLTAEVTDVDLQTVSNGTALWQHPAEFYGGIRLPQPMLKVGAESDVEAVAVGLDGKFKADVPLTVIVEHRNYDPQTGASKPKEVARCDLKSTATGPVRCTFKATEAGLHTVRLEASDAQDRKVVASLNLSVYGGETEIRNLDFQFERTSYKPGEKARALVRSTVPGVHGLLTISRGGLLSHKSIKLTGNLDVIEFQIPQDAEPQLQVSLALVAGRRDIPPNAYGQDVGAPFMWALMRPLSISLERKRLDVSIKPDLDEARPGQELSVEVTVRDHTGALVPNAEVSLAAIDQGLLSMLGVGSDGAQNAHIWPDLTQSFWTTSGHRHGLTGSMLHLIARRYASQFQGAKKAKLNRRSEPTAVVKDLMGGSAGDMAEFDEDLDDARAEKAMEERPAKKPVDAAAKGPSREQQAPAGTSPPNPRSDFKEVAHWSPALKTDAKGRAKVSYTLPDDLTTWTLVAIALDDEERFGRGSASMKVAQPLLLRASLPRFANPGDRFDATVVVQNETNKAMEATVGLNLGDAEPGRGLAAAKEGSLKARQIKLPAGGAVEVAFDVVAQRPGTTSLTFDVRAPGFEDAVKVPLEVIVPVSTQTVAAYGDTTSARAYPMIPPGEVHADVGGLKVSLTSTAMVGLEGGLRYLVGYPHGCLEQTVSRAMPMVAMDKLVSGFDLDVGPSREFVLAAVRKLERMQHVNGAFGYWSNTSAMHVYGSVYAMHLLAQARADGYKVNEQVYQRGLAFLRGQVASIHNEPGAVIAAHAAWILAREKSLNAAVLQRLVDKVDQMPFFAVGFVAMAAHHNGDEAGAARALRRLTNGAIETAVDAHFIEPQRHNWMRTMWHSNMRTDAIALLAILTIDPEHPLTPKVARWLLKSRKQGRWGNTQENAWALLALGRYFSVREGAVPDFEARAWLGEQEVLKANFKGRQFDARTFEVPMEALVSAVGEDKESLLTVAKEGPGRLYYAMHMSYAPASRELKPRSEGFTVKRDYQVVGDGGWLSDTSHQLKFPSGAYVKVRVTVEVPEQRHYVVVDDALPAGLEVVDARFATSNQAVVQNRYYHASHFEMRDERVVFYIDHMPPGTYTYEYTARTTTRGNFALQPARAEDMYAPETFGHSAAATFIVD